MCPKRPLSGSLLLAEFCDIFLNVFVAFPQPSDKFYNIFLWRINKFHNFFFHSVADEFPDLSLQFVAETRKFFFFSHDQLTNFMIFSCNQMTKFTIFSPCNWLTNFIIFFLVTDNQFHIIFRDRWTNLVVSSCKWLTKLTMFFSRQIEKFIYIFSVMDKQILWYFPSNCWTNFTIFFLGGGDHQLFLSSSPKVFKRAVRHCTLPNWHRVKTNI